MKQVNLWNKKINFGFVTSILKIFFYYGSDNIFCNIQFFCLNSALNDWTFPATMCFQKTVPSATCVLWKRDIDLKKECTPKKLFSWIQLYLTIWLLVILNHLQQQNTESIFQFNQSRQFQTIKSLNPIFH